MGDWKCLTAEEVAQRYRRAVSVGTLRNWRAMRFFPAFVKIGKAILRLVDELDAWDKRNMVARRASRRLTMTDILAAQGLPLVQLSDQLSLCGVPSRGCLV